MTPARACQSRLDGGRGSIFIARVRGGTSSRSARVSAAAAALNPYVWITTAFPLAAADLCSPVQPISRCHAADETAALQTLQLVQPDLFATDIFAVKLQSSPVRSSTQQQQRGPSWQQQPSLRPAVLLSLFQVTEFFSLTSTPIPRTDWSHASEFPDAEPQEDGRCRKVRVRRPHSWMALIVLYKNKLHYNLTLACAVSVY